MFQVTTARNVPGAAERNKQLATRMREALGAKRRAYNRLKQETALFRCDRVRRALVMQPRHFWMPVLAQNSE